MRDLRARFLVVFDKPGSLGIAYSPVEADGVPTRVAITRIVPGSQASKLKKNRPKPG